VTLQLLVVTLTRSTRRAVIPYDDGKETLHLVDTLRYTRIVEDDRGNVSTLPRSSVV
jgi:hypothetical protein